MAFLLKTKCVPGKAAPELQRIPNVVHRGIGSKTPYIDKMAGNLTGAFCREDRGLPPETEGSASCRFQTTSAINPPIISEKTRCTASRKDGSYLRRLATGYAVWAAKDDRLNGFVSPSSQDARDAVDC